MTAFNLSTIPMDTRPVLRWAGSKTKILTKLEQAAPKNFHRYVEPFAGSAVLFFRLSPEKAIISDLNPELINTYRQIVRSPRKLAEAINTFPRESDYFYSLRSLDPSNLSSFDRATRFLYLNRNCFNGLYRTNQKGQFNVPFCPTKSGKNLTSEEFCSAARRLRCASLRTADFQETIDCAKKGDFYYMDPPFAIGNRRMFRQYNSATFGLGDLDRLLDGMRNLNKKGVKFLVSYAWSHDTRKKFGEWNTKRLIIQRNIAGFSKDRKCAYEILVTNY